MSHNKPHIFLAQKQPFGVVYQCEGGCMHVQVGRVNISLSSEEYIEFVDMVNQSAANFELAREGSEVEDGESPCG